MLLRFAPIDCLDQTDLALSILELSAFATGEVLLSDLPIDFDTILANVQSNPDKYGLGDERDVLADEPVAARQLLEELMFGRVLELFDSRAKKFAKNYAFERVPGAATSIRCKAIDQLSAGAYATAWLSFFCAIDTSGALDMPKRDIRALRMLYAKVFELVALLACSVIGPSVGWWTGRSWGEVEKISNFQRLCDVVGYGKLKAVDDWEAIQIQAKDAGADGFLVTLIGGQVSSGSVCIALGATVQKKQRQKKKVGKDQRDRLLGFFTNRPTIALIGAAADPYPHEPVLAQDYAAADCLYLHGEALWQLLVLYDSSTKLGSLDSMVREIETTLKEQVHIAFAGSSIEILGVSHNLNAFLGQPAAA